MGYPDSNNIEIESLSDDDLDSASGGNDMVADNTGTGTCISNSGTGTCTAPPRVSPTDS